MTERSYTLKEIDRMREAVENYLGYSEQMPWTREARIVLVEERLRTCLGAGVSVDELETAAKEASDAWLARRDIERVKP
jgi:hypothetical protein